jgi:CIC family chloride channel protein
MGGAIIRALLITYSHWSDAYGDGASQSMQNFYDSYKEKDTQYRYKKSTLWQSVRRVIMTFLTLGTGGSGGLEGPAIPVGEGVGAWFGKTFHIKDNDTLRALQLAGISACVCTLLQSPLTSVIFAAEMVFCGRFLYQPMMFGLMASLVAYFLNNHISHLEPLYKLPSHTSMYSLTEYLEITVVAILVSIPTGLGLKGLLALFRKGFSYLPLVTRSPIAALIISGFVWGVVTHLGLPVASVVGIGEELLGDLLNAHVVEMSFQMLIGIILAKAFVTVLTLMAGGSAGLLIPATFLGAFCGALAYKTALFMGLTQIGSPILYIITGLASSLVAVVEIPLTAIVLVIEVFGKGFGPSAILAVCMCNFFITQIRKKLSK